LNRFVYGFLSNDSFFGRLMTKVAIVVGANLMFLLFSIPVVTIGPALAALYYVMLETLFRNGALNPFKTFWKGFKMNLKQGIGTWLIALALIALAYFDIRFSSWAGGIFSAFLVGIYIVLAAAVIIYTYLYPVMTSFNGTVKDHYKNAIYFAFKKPLKMILLVAVEAGAALLTYGFPDMLPMWAFCWFFFGFGAIAMLGAKLLLPLFMPFQEGYVETPKPSGKNTDTAKKKQAVAAAGTDDQLPQKETPEAQDQAKPDQAKPDRAKPDPDAEGLDAWDNDIPDQDDRDQTFRLSDDDLDSMDELKKLDGL